MTFISIRKLVVAGAVALGATAYYIGTASAACSTSPCVGEWQTFPVQVTVDDTISVDGTTNPLSFGDVGAIKDGTDVAHFTMDPDGTPTDDAGDGVFGASPAAIVSDPNGAAPAAGQIAVSNAFDNVHMWVDYCIGGAGSCAGIGAVGDEKMTNGGAEYFILQEVHDDLATAAGAGGGACGATACANGSYDSTTDTRTTGIGVVQVGGTMTYDIGGTIATQTDDSYGPYTDGVYTGQYNALYSY